MLSESSHPLTPVRPLHYQSHSGLVTVTGEEDSGVALGVRNWQAPVFPPCQCSTRGCNALNKHFMEGFMFPPDSDLEHDACFESILVAFVFNQLWF